ncbi:hypothetical protein [Saccharicrinis fermentans]|uniref:EF-hand domain-containing protein n=1 Tax=Saccharicrinis fermentans DSM 9555 = JCM 21142 TaxID=869213 RepID=W7Y4M8_9BACT|nr:hypothetical protein [Saccharicrinis fermentans]GAF05860.1 hypothetical protein JCM21142_114616 [Saccharicrinis fermentans DSM 9555 = JCM 21142]
MTNFISNTKGDGDENKHFAKLSAETALKIAIPISLPANMPVKSTGCSNYVSIMEQVEVAELELVISDRNTQLPKYYKSGFYTFESTEEDQSRLTEFNKLIGGCAQIGDKVKLVEEFDGTDYRRVIYMPSQKGLRFWVEKVKLEDKILTYNLPEEEQVGPLRLPDEYDEYDEYIGGSVFGTSRYFQFIEDGNAIEEKPTEEKTYLILNTPLSEVNILNPIDYQDVSIESDIIVDTKTATHYHDDEEKEWLLIDHKDIGANGAPVNYKGLIKEEELTDRFSAYDWAKFGFEIKDAGAEYIYNFDEKSDFFNEICELVDQDENGILEPYELQRALNSHYTAHKLSQLVCKHHSEWAYGGQYLSSLMNQVTGVFDEGIKLESDDTRKQALEELKTERLDAFEAKVCQLYYWQDINIPALESKPINFVEGAFTTQQTTGKYLKFEDSSWVSKTDSSNESPVDLVAFPIDNPVVYHFHPVAFVEQMRRINGGFYYEIYHTGEIICNGDIEKAKEVSFIYYDKNGGKHELGTYKLVEVPDFESGKTKKPTANLNNYEVRSGTYNRKKKTIWYKKKNKKFKAVNIKENFTGSHYVYTKDDFVLKFKSISNRPYARPECFAALLGAIADTGYEDIKINGFTSKDGTSFPSVSHPGGINVDISNLDNADFKTADGGIKIANSNYSRERTRTLANSMIKFRYYRIRTSDVELCKYGANASKWDCTNKEKPCRYITGHEDHLHCEGFNNK